LIFLGEHKNSFYLKTLYKLFICEEKSSNVFEENQMSAV